MRNWRPSDWNIDKIIDKVDEAKGIEGDYVEAGADAMLKAMVGFLKDKSLKLLIADGEHIYTTPTSVLDEFAFYYPED